MTLSPRARNLWEFAAVIPVGLVILLPAFGMPEIRNDGRPRCTVMPHTLVIGMDREAIVDARAGASCSIVLVGRFGSIDKVELLDAPQHGDVTIMGRARIQYRPANGFVGLDTFSFGPKSSTSPDLSRYAVKVLVEAKR